MLVKGRFTGAAYPFGPSPDGTLGPRDDVATIIASIANILTTPKGSVRYNQSIGSVVPELLFDINDEITRNLVRYYVRKDITEQDSRVRIENVFTEVPEDGYTIIVTLAFSLVGDPLAQVYSAPVIFPREG
jgi:phage baseplate assembly protein W